MADPAHDWTYRPTPRLRPTDVNTFLTTLAGQLSAACPGELRSVYVIGSRANDTALADSDADLAVILRQGAPSETESRLSHVLHKLRRTGPVMVDLTVVREEAIRRGVAPNLKANRLLAGEDVLQRCPLRPRPELAPVMTITRDL